MNPFLWLLWAIAAIIILFIAAAVIHLIIEKYRELPPKRSKNEHYNHVHWAMKPEGDELIYDQGGIFGPPQPGVNMNAKPEPVLTGEQWDALDGKTTPGAS